MQADKHNRLFFPEITLLRSTESKTGFVLYSANLTRQYGRGARTQIYVDQRSVPVPRPNAALLMAYQGDAVLTGEGLQKLEGLGNGSKSLIFRMERLDTFAASVRFESDAQNAVHSLYLPRKVAKEQGAIWVHIVFADREIESKL